IDFLLEIFPDAFFIHLVRDGRAVAESLLNVGFWDGWRGPPAWRCGELKPAYQQEWDRSKRSFVILAGIQWKLLLDSVEEAKKKVKPGQFLEMKYEDFAANPRCSLRKTLSFCQLDCSEEFNTRLDTFSVKDMNYKWRENLTFDQQRILEDSLKEHLAR